MPGQRVRWATRPPVALQVAWVLPLKTPRQWKAEPAQVPGAWVPRALAEQVLVELPEPELAVLVLVLVAPGPARVPVARVAAAGPECNSIPT